MRHLSLLLLSLVGLLACSPPPRPASSAAASSQTPTALVLLNPRAGLYTAGQPAAADWQVLAERGIRTVINLRPAEELQGRDEAAEVRAAGLAYLELPIAVASDLNADNAATLQRLLQTATGPVLLHCGSANRAGGLLALMAALNEGQSEQAALELGRKAGMKGTETAVQAALRAETCDKQHQQQGC